MTKISVPGKLYLAGEYAVTHPGQSALIAAVDRFITITLTDNADFILESDKLGTLINPLHKEISAIAPSWRLMYVTLQQIINLNQAKFDKSTPPFKISVQSQLDQNGTKLGLGSSGALVVGMLQAANQHFNWQLTQLELFKLAVLTMLDLPNFAKGSMGDVATASYGGVIFYQNFDRAELALLREHNSLLDQLSQPWSKLSIQTVNWPTNWQFNVGWTQKAASTQSRLNSTSQKALKPFLEQSTKLVQTLRLALEEADFNQAVATIRKAQQLLLNYTDANGVNYLTPALKQLLAIADKYQLPTKISGAGGGDNGYAITHDQLNQTQLLKSWQAVGILPLDLTIWQH